MPKEVHIEYRRLILSLIPPSIFLLLIWLVKIVEVIEGADWYHLGIFSGKISGLKGILFSPLIHSNFSHLVNNSIPFLVLLTAIFYFYQKVAWRVFFYSYLITGIMVWTLARPSYHIGASGLVYSFAAFLFVSGIIRRNINLMAISLLVIFLYGSMIWGIFPYLPDMSWESHLIGFTIGAVLAIIFRHEGPGPTKFISDMEDDDEENETDMSGQEAPPERKTDIN